MSKRFGRNQKRKMRQEIHRLESWLGQERALNTRNRQIVEETAQVLGRHFITLDPDTVEIQELDQLAHGWRVLARPELPLYAMEAGELPSFQTFTEIVLPILYGSTAADDLRRYTHIRFTYAGRNVGYSIETDALRMLPPKVAAQRIAQEMASHLLKDLEAIT